MKTLPNETATIKNGILSQKVSPEIPEKSSTNRMITATSVYSGPLPTPEAFNKYVSILNHFLFSWRGAPRLVPTKSITLIPRPLAVRDLF